MFPVCPHEEITLVFIGGGTSSWREHRLSPGPISIEQAGCHMEKSSAELGKMRCSPVVARTGFQLAFPEMGRVFGN